jgi:lipopolysaccharide biosynthesis glycosyltransferase
MHSIGEVNMRESNEVIQLVVCTDNNFIAHTATLLQSVKQHTSMAVNVHLFAQLNSTESSKIASLNSESFRIHIEENLPDYSDLPISEVFRNRLSQSAFWRIAIPDILVKYEKALYLDSDMIAVGDIAPLWRFDVSNVAAAVVSDSLLTPKRPWVNLEMPNEHYFNSGMMLMNLTKWRRDDLTAKTLRLVKENPDWPYNDQHALNVALNNDVKFVPKEWNVQTQCLLNTPTIEPIIVHFTGFEKPWHQTSAHPYTEHYRNIRASTSFRTSVYPLVIDSDDLKIIERLRKEVPNGGPIGIWGAGMRGRRLITYIRENCPSYEIVTLIDTAVKGEYNGLPVKASLSEEPIEGLVIATLPHRNAILTSLPNEFVTRVKVI